MKTSASKGISTCHSTPTSVHAICFMPFEVDLFMATTQSQFYLTEVAMTDSLTRIHEELSLKGQK